MTNGKRFAVVHKEGTMWGMSFRIIKDTKTGVLYLYTTEGYGTTMTPLLNSDGKPVTSPGKN